MQKLLCRDHIHLYSQLIVQHVFLYLVMQMIHHLNRWNSMFFHRQSQVSVALLIQLQVLIVSQYITHHTCVCITTQLTQKLSSLYKDCRRNGWDFSMHFLPLKGFLNLHQTFFQIYVQLYLILSVLLDVCGPQQKLPACLQLVFMGTLCGQ